MSITKVSLSFPAKVWWVIVRAQLRPTGNDNTLMSPLASLVACLMDGYPVNLVDSWIEANRITAASKIKDVANHLFGAKFVVVVKLALVPLVPFNIPHANRGPEQDQRQNRALVDQIVAKLPQVVQWDVINVEKRIKAEMQTELVVLKDRMDGLEVHVQNQLQVVDSVNAKKLKTQLVELRAKIAKLAEKPVIVPPPIVPESLMHLFNEPPPTQVLDDLWGEVPQHKSSKRKHKVGESDKEQPKNLSKEENKRNKKSCKESRKKSREEEAVEQQRRNVLLAGASGSAIPPSCATGPADPVKDSDSAPMIRVLTLIQLPMPSAS
ncbi:hypothetical protein KY284_001033 [Solanum tuberosum]|nr:hypothetical protein KY284_001033 [Solanum tuberosum]